MLVLMCSLYTCESKAKFSGWLDVTFMCTVINVVQKSANLHVAVACSCKLAAAAAVAVAALLQQRNRMADAGHPVRPKQLQLIPVDRESAAI